MLDVAIIGDGPARKETEAMFERFGSRVDFVGALAGDEVAARLQLADLLVWPGVGEAFGMVYLEAQAESRPVVAEDRPGVREVVRDGGWLAPPGDAQVFAAIIDRLASHPDELRQAGLRARAQVEADHLKGSASATLREALLPLVREPRR